MDNYKEMYYHLFNQVTDIINRLKSIQQQTEEMFINYTPDNIATDIEITINN